MDNKKDVKGFLEFVYEFYKSMKAHEIGRASCRERVY
jgi:hypothetical protein